MKFKNKFLCILLLSISPSFLFGIEAGCFKINCDTNYLDSKGQKQGFWRLCNDGLCTEAYYLNDLLNGVYKTFYQNGKISSLGEYENGRMIGKWYYFDEKGHLTIEITNIRNKGYLIKNVNNQYVKYMSKAFLKLYYENGFCKEEGLALFNDVELEIVKIRKWKCYDIKGKRENIKESE